MRFLFLFACIALQVAGAFGQPYVWLTDHEMRLFGPDGDYHPFGNGDTTIGWIRSNDQITIAGSCVLGRVETSASNFGQGPDYNPTFTEPPIFNAPPYVFPSVANVLRGGAMSGGNYYDPGDEWQMRARINGSFVWLAEWPLGVGFDSSAVNWLPPIFIGILGTCIFTETPLELEGRDVMGSITIGSAKQIRLMNDVRVAGPTSGPPEYRIDPSNPNFIGIVSEGDIKIGNTPANGRENSAGQGYLQVDQGLTSIVITAAVLALGGSFKFEQQNDMDSCYSGPTPDDRGTIYFHGSLTQRDRGYLRRSNNLSTGYRLSLRYDERFNTQMPPCYFELPDSTQVTTDTLDFGDVIVGQTALDTADVFSPEFGTLGAVMASWPFEAERVEPFTGSHFRIPASFTPPHAGSFDGILMVSVWQHFFEIVLRGRGVAGSAPVAAPSLYPNPFNAATTFTFELAAHGRVTADLYDITGRLVERLTDDEYVSGKHQLRINGESLASGIYFIRLATAARTSTHKLLLVK